MYIDNIRIMKKYQHILAAMIEQSQGYFTPQMAAIALTAYKKKVPFSCEWYLDMAGLGRTKKLFEITDEELIEMNHQVISIAFSNREYRRKGIEHYLSIINQDINGNESIAASCF